MHLSTSLTLEFLSESSEEFFLFLLILKERSPFDQFKLRMKTPSHSEMPTFLDPVLNRSAIIPRSTKNHDLLELETSFNIENIPCNSLTTTNRTSHNASDLLSPRGSRRSYFPEAQKNRHMTSLKFKERKSSARKKPPKPQSDKKLQKLRNSSERAQPFPVESQLTPITSTYSS